LKKSQNEKKKNSLNSFLNNQKSFIE